MQAATEEFIAFVLRSRPDWHEEELRRALLVCKGSGWTWQRTVSVTWTTMCLGDGTPDDIRNAANPLAGRGPARRG